MHSKKIFNLIALMVLASSPLLFCMENSPLLFSMEKRLNKIKTIAKKRFQVPFTYENEKIFLKYSQKTKPNGVILKKYAKINNYAEIIQFCSLQNKTVCVKRSEKSKFFPDVLLFTVFNNKPQLNYLKAFHPIYCKVENSTHDSVYIIDPKRKLSLHEKIISVESILLNKKTIKLEEKKVNERESISNNSFYFNGKKNILNLEGYVVPEATFNIYDSLYNVTNKKIIRILNLSTGCNFNNVMDILECAEKKTKNKTLIVNTTVEKQAELKKIMLKSIACQKVL